MTWETMDEVGRFYGLNIGWGCLIGAFIGLFNSWRA